MTPGAYRIALSLSPISMAAQAESKYAISGNVGYGVSPSFQVKEVGMPLSLTLNEAEGVTLLSNTFERMFSEPVREVHALRIMRLKPDFPDPLMP